MPLSTWAAAVLVQLDNAGIHTHAPNKIMAEPFYVYLKTIPFIFYSILVVISVWFIVVTRIAYGSIASDEHNIVAVDNTSYDELIDEQAKKHSLSELLLPILILIGGMLIGILYAGNYHLFGGNNSFVDAFRENNKTFLVLLASGLAAFTFSVLLSLYKKMISVVQIPMIVYQGFMLMQASIMMVALASILGSFLRVELQTGSYIAHLLLGIAPVFLIPAMLFMVSLIITLTTGSAWGTFSLLIPITTQMLIAFLQLDVPVALDQIPILFPSLGAVLSGAVCGNHISPIAETTMMTATSTGIEPLEHARSQFWYVAPVIVGTVVSFIIAGLLCDRGLVMSLFASLGAGITITIVVLMVLNYAEKRD